MKKTLSILATAVLLLSAGSALAYDQVGPTVGYATSVTGSTLLNLSVSGGTINFTIASSENARNGVSDATTTLALFNNKWGLSAGIGKITAQIDSAMPSGQELLVTLAPMAYAGGFGGNTWGSGDSAGPLSLADGSAIAALTSVRNVDGSGAITYKWTPGSSTAHIFSRTVILTAVDE